MIWGERLSWRLARTRAGLVVPEVYDHLRKRRNIMIQNAGTLKANNSYYQKDLPLESGIQQALNKCTRGAFPVLFQLRPKATRQSAQGVQTGPPLRSRGSRYRGRQSSLRTAVKGRGRAPDPAAQPWGRAGPAGRGLSTGRPQPFLGRTLPRVSEDCGLGRFQPASHELGDLKAQVCQISQNDITTDS